MHAHTAAEYADQLRQLMPRGAAWSNDPGGPNHLLKDGEGEELARIEARAIYLVLKEFYPQTTRELLEEWEKEWGLPDECRQLGATYEERIEDLLRKFRSLGGQSKAYLISVAAALGITISITECRVFRAGRGRAGEGVYDRKWLHVFRVSSPTSRIYYFRAGSNSAGDRLRHWRRNELLECIINRLKPAHTYAIFSYFDDRE